MRFTRGLHRHNSRLMNPYWTIPSWYLSPLTNLWFLQTWCLLIKCPPPSLFTWYKYEQEKSEKCWKIEHTHRASSRQRVSWWANKTKAWKRNGIELLFGMELCWILVNPKDWHGIVLNLGGITLTWLNHIERFLHEIYPNTNSDSNCRLLTPWSVLHPQNSTGNIWKVEQLSRWWICRDGVGLGMFGVVSATITIGLNSCLARGCYWFC